MDLGTLGTVHEPPPEPEVDTFDYFGEQVRLNPALYTVPDLVAADLAELIMVISTADTGRAKDNTDVMGYGKALLRLVIHPLDFNGFWDLAYRHNQDLLDDVVPVAFEIVKAVTGRPTVRQPDSSPGLPGEPPSSEGDVFSEHRARFEAKGRSDLAQIVRDAERAEQARRGEPVSV